jgi:hypothetical protein
VLDVKQFLAVFAAQRSQREPVDDLTQPGEA